MINAIEDPAVDDIYTYIRFTISEPDVNIAPIGTVKIGEKFRIFGTTNLQEGDELLIEAISSSFGPTKKNQAGGFSGFTGQSEVISGDGSMNEFEVEVDSSNFIEDEYIVTVSSIINDNARASTIFTVYGTAPPQTPTPVVTTSTVTPEPTTVVTTVPTPEPTTVVTTVPTPEPTPVTTVPTPIPPTPIPPTPTPTPAPGFGALIALGGLGVVGYLIVRKD